VRAPGAKKTLLTMTFDVTGMTGSAHTVPVNVLDRSSEGAPSVRP
jgi:hypothetical protein